MRTRALVLAAAGVLAAPGTASAHLRGSTPAVDYEATVAPLAAPLAGAVAVRVYRVDRALGVEALPGHTVVVLGYTGEPFLRLDRHGASVNAASLTAAGTGLAEAVRSKTPRWRPYADEPSIVWHDARLHGLPPGVDQGRWAVPVLVDGRRTSIGGTLRRVHTPPAWPWLVLGACFLAATGWALAHRQPERLRTAATALGAVAGTATLVMAIGFAAGSTASEGVWLEAGNAIILVVFGLGFLIWGSAKTRALAGGMLGLVSLAIGLTELPVFRHGLVLSALPGNLTRLAVATTIAAGAAAAIVGVFVFFDVLEHYEEPASSDRYL
ncbi:MAG TPA: hypothetical protein VH297_12605 [Gaiellaceae bacterium]